MLDQKVTFGDGGRKDPFLTLLHQRVNQYLKQEGLSRYGGYRIWLKSIFMFSLYVVPFLMLVFGFSDSNWFYLWVVVMMGIGTSGIGFGVMHDACHGSFSNKSWVNHLMGLSLNFLGGHHTCWRIQHNVLHHTYTNIKGLDEDIATTKMLRFSPHEPLRKRHRYQHFYAWFFYGLMTLNWTFTKDFLQLKRYNRMGLLATQNTTLRKEMTLLIFTKAFYFFYVFAVPIIWLSIPFWKVILGFVIIHFVAGSILAWVFQLAHVSGTPEYPTKSEEGHVGHDWGAHQLITTMNFGGNRIFSWFIGGLDYQVEHHLMPHISHTHYRRISEIVRKTAEEFNLPYNRLPSFGKGVVAHLNWLKTLGRNQNAMPSPA